MPEPDWLPRLRAALFASVMLPEVDEAFVVEGTTYVCQRRLDYDERLVYHEVWIDPRTYRVQRSWQQELEAGAFVGAVPDSVFQQQVAQLVEWLNIARPRQRPIVPSRTFSPQRFAQTPQGRRP